MREYIVWRTEENAIDWFVLREGRYERFAPQESKLYQREVFPGLWLDVEALCSGDLATVLKRKPMDRQPLSMRDSLQR